MIDVRDLAQAQGGLHALDLPISKEGMDFATRWVYCDDSKLRPELGPEYRPLMTTLADAVRWLESAGHMRGDWATAVPD